MLRPILTPQALKDTYKAISSSDLRQSVLNNFMLVKHRLNDPSALRGETAQDQAITNLLIEITSQEFDQLRHKHGLPALNDQCTRQEALQDMRVIDKHGDNLLVGACIIYYAFVRYDLGLHLKNDIYNVFNASDRSGQRNANQFLRHMVSVLLQLEQETRAKDRATRCWLTLPHQAIIPLESQQRIFDSLSGDFPQMTVIHGQAQMGKTTLALSVGYHLIQDSRIAEVVWLDLRNKPSQTLAGLVCEAIQLPIQHGYTSEQILDGYLQLLQQEDQYLLIILDNCDDWHTAISSAWRWLSHCVVVATGYYAFPLHGQAIQFDIFPLQRTEAQQLLEFWNQSVGKDWHPFFDEIWGTIGGNPGALHHTLSLLGLLPISSIFSTTALADYYIRTWQQLSKTEQDLWLILNMWGMVTYERLESLALPAHQLNSALLRLLEVGFLFNDGNLGYQTPPLIRPVVLPILGETIERVMTQFSHFESIILAFFGYYEFYSYVTHLLKELIPPAHEQVAVTGQWQWWLDVCQYLASANFLPENDQLLFRLEAAIALRWLGRFNEGLAELDKILGCKPDDQLQTQALIEQSTLFFYNHQLSEALAAAQAAYACMESDRSRLAVLRVLSHVDPQRARTWIPHFDQRDVAISTIWAELELKLDNFPQAVIAARRALQLMPNHLPGYARSQCLLAQALALQGEFEESEITFVDAVNRLIYHHDIVGLARFYTNYSVIMFYAKRWEDARRLSQQALGLYDKLQDTHGRQAAEENLRLINEASHQH